MNYTSVRVVTTQEPSPTYCSPAVPSESQGQAACSAVSAVFT